jgi:hypothetical protein
MGVDLFLQGEFVAYGGTVDRTRSIDGELEVPAYTFCYNSSLFAQRVQDILTAVRFAQTIGAGRGRIAVVGRNGAGPLVAAALPQARGALAGAALATAGFRFDRLRDVRDVDFLPGGARYGDLPGMLALAGPARVVSLDAPGMTPSSALAMILPSPR